MNPGTFLYTLLSQTHRGPMTTKEEFVEAAEDLLTVMMASEPFDIGQVVTGSYAGCYDGFGVISKIAWDADGSGYFELTVQWEDGEATLETCDEVIRLEEYAELTGRHYDAEYIKDKIAEKVRLPNDAQNNS
jgi:hypothetical protein